MRDRTLREQIETTLYTAGVYESGSLAEAIMEQIEEQGKKVYKSSDGFLYPSVDEAVANEGAGVTLDVFLMLPTEAAEVL